MIESTLFSSIKSNTIVSLVWAFCLVIEEDDETWVSAKFLSPTGCKSWLTGLDKSIYCLELLTEYDKFW